MADVLIVDATTGERTERDFTPEEIAQREVDAAAAAVIEAERVERVAARAALLERLGISEDEAVLLLGGGA